jgi:hypothetical protein
MLTAKTKPIHPETRRRRRRRRRKKEGGNGMREHGHT